MTPPAQPQNAHAELGSAQEPPTLILTTLLNLAHGIDHLFLLIFASAVSAIAQDFGFSKWEDLMPYGTWAFLMFGLGSIPCGRLGDLWGRRQMMLIFFFGMGVAAVGCACAQTVLQLTVGLTLIGTFASIYHPIGIPMLLERSTNAGATIGLNGLAGNLGVALVAILTGFLIKYLGWRAAFGVPALLSVVCGGVFYWVCPKETEAPAKRIGGAKVQLTSRMLTKALAVMTAAAASSSVLFNVSTNGNAQLISERFTGVIEDPSTLGILLAVVYTVSSFAQVVVGHLISRFPLKPFFLLMVVAQIPTLIFASMAQGWWLLFCLLMLMIFIFGAVPFTDVLISRYVDDRLRSRVAGMRLGISLGLSSLGVWALGPVVKSLGFANGLLILALFSITTACILTLLPSAKDELLPH
ncbi:MAG: MFS transporter [Betaproteobacteria bacterium]